MTQYESYQNVIAQMREDKYRKLIELADARDMDINTLAGQMIEAYIESEATHE